MKLVIDIPNSLYANLSKIEYGTNASKRLLDCIKNGTPLPKGHWVRKNKVDAYDIAGVKTWGIKCQCDKCDFSTIVIEDFGYYRFCPNCGADMRGDDNGISD